MIVSDTRIFQQMLGVGDTRLVTGYLWGSQ